MSTLFLLVVSVVVAIATKIYIWFKIYTINREQGLSSSIFGFPLLFMQAFTYRNRLKIPLYVLALCTVVFVYCIIKLFVFYGNSASA